MEQLNKIEIRGNVGGVRVQPVGNSMVAHFTVATNYAYKGKDGTPVIETTWHNVSAWQGKGIENLADIQKGAKVQVAGRMRTQKYTGEDAMEHTVYEIVAKNVTLITGAENLQYEM